MFTKFKWGMFVVSSKKFLARVRRDCFVWKTFLNLRKISDGLKN